VWKHILKEYKVSLECHFGEFAVAVEHFLMILCLIIDVDKIVDTSLMSRVDGDKGHLRLTVMCFPILRYYNPFQAHLEREVAALLSNR
jgi:hypothetical protein